MFYSAYKTVEINGHPYRVNDNPNSRYQRHPVYGWLIVDTWGTGKTLAHINPRHAMPRRIVKRFNAAHKAKNREGNLAARATINSAHAKNTQREPNWSGCTGPAAPYTHRNLPKAA